MCGNLFPLFLFLHFFPWVHIIVCASISVHFLLFFACFLFLFLSTFRSSCLCGSPRLAFPALGLASPSAPPLLRLARLDPCPRQTSSVQLSIHQSEGAGRCHSLLLCYFASAPPFRLLSAQLFPRRKRQGSGGETEQGPRREDTVIDGTRSARQESETRPLETRTESNNKGTREGLRSRSPQAQSVDAPHARTQSSQSRAPDASVSGRTQGRRRKKKAAGKRKTPEKSSGAKQAPSQLHGSTPVGSLGLQGMGEMCV